MTQTRKEALIELRDKVRAGDAAEVAGCLGGMVVKDTSWDFASQVISAHRGSLDAAKALHEAVLPGWSPSIGQNVHHKHWLATVMRAENGTIVEDETAGNSVCPARAWLLAILEALIAKAGDGE